MIKSPNSILADAPPITSPDHLFSVVLALGQNTVKFCERLADEMKTMQNGDTAQVFSDLALREREHINSVLAQAEQAGAEIDAEIDNIWLERDLRGDLAREIADNPYLMTPYRALRLAVINKERIFEILSTLAANQENDAIRQHAESLARMELAEIAELRLRRRRASRSEVETAIEKSGLGKPPLELENFNKIAETVHAIIRTLTLTVRETWASELTAQTGEVLDGILDDFQDFPDVLTTGENRAALEAGIRQHNDSLFAALKTLLRELESAVDLFLGYAETTSSEEVVHGAQTKAERYVHRIAKIRDELNVRVGK